MSSLKRRWFEVKRIFRRQPLLLLIFLISILGFLFFISSARNVPKEYPQVADSQIQHPGAAGAADDSNLHLQANGHGGSSGGKDNNQHNQLQHPVLAGNEEQQPVGQPKTEDGNNNDDLPGSHDTESLLTPDKVGYFEQVPVILPPENPNAEGEDGRPIVTDLNSPEVRKANQEYGFNTVASDKASLNRSIPDVRMEECKFWQYPEQLPTASVVIAFHNEGWSPLLRTVHSVLLRSPAHLLKEVILVDDASEKEHLKTRLEDYIKQFNGKVRLVRNAEREGLINTRTNGAKAAAGDVVIFLDAHCEVNRNWLPPLLAPIRRNRPQLQTCDDRAGD